MAEISLYDGGRITTKQKIKQVMPTSVFHMITMVPHGRISPLSTCSFCCFLFQEDSKDLGEFVPNTSEMWDCF